VDEAGRELSRLPIRELVIEPEPIGGDADHPAAHRELRADELLAVVPGERIRDQEKYARSSTPGGVQAQRFGKSPSRAHPSGAIRSYLPT
jgi:hypothetical protein